MRQSGFLWIIVGVMLILDIYVYQAVKTVSASVSPKWRLLVTSLYWLLAVISLGILILRPYVNYESLPKAVRTYAFALIVGLFFPSCWPRSLLRSMTSGAAPCG